VTYCNTLLTFATRYTEGMPCPSASENGLPLRESQKRLAERDGLLTVQEDQPPRDPGYAPQQKCGASGESGGRIVLCWISRDLAANGFLNERGNPYAAKSVASMLG